MDHEKDTKRAQPFRLRCILQTNLLNVGARRRKPLLNMEQCSWNQKIRADEAGRADLKWQMVDESR